MKKRVVSVLLLIVSILISITGCSSSNSQIRPPSKNEIRFALDADPTSLDPRLAGTCTSQILTRAVFEGLTRIGRDGRPNLALANSYSVSNDKTSYIFSLRPSKWSNGMDVTAEDFVYAWSSVLSHSTSSSYAYAYFLLKNGKAVYQRKAPLEALGVKAINPSTLEITLEHPVPYFLELLSNPIFSPVCKSVAETYPNWVVDHFVSNGPFVVDQYELKNFLILKKNPFYWDQDSVKIDALSFSIIADSSTAYNMFLTGALDWYGDPFTTMHSEFSQELAKKNALRITGKATIRWIVCNTQKKHLSTPEVRQALSMAIQRSSLCKDLLQNEEEPAFSILPKILSFFPQHQPKENPIAAKKFLDTSLQQLGFSAGEYPTFHLLLAGNSDHLLICQALQDQLKKDLNIDLQLEICEKSMYWSRLYTGNFDMAMTSWYSWIADPIDTLDYLRDRNNGINSTGWGSAEYTSLLEASDAEPDPEKRKALLAQAESLVMNELPIIPVCTETGRYAKRDIQNEIFSTIGELELKEIQRTPG